MLLAVRNKVLGVRRLAGPDPWAEVDALAALVQDLRGGRPLCRRGLFRFRSHDEADAWMRAELIAERHGLPRSPTSSSSHAG